MKRLSHGCFQRLDLAQHLRPFSRCLECNSLLRPIAKAEILDRLPASVGARHQEFTTCDSCGRLYWRGSHWQRMQQMLQLE